MRLEIEMLNLEIIYFGMSYGISFTNLLSVVKPKFINHKIKKLMKRLDTKILLILQPFIIFMFPAPFNIKVMEFKVTSFLLLFKN